MVPPASEAEEQITCVYFASVPDQMLFAHDGSDGTLEPSVQVAWVVVMGKVLVDV